MIIHLKMSPFIDDDWLIQEENTLWACETVISLSTGHHQGHIGDISYIHTCTGYDHGLFRMNCMSYLSSVDGLQV